MGTHGQKPLPDSFKMYFGTHWVNRCLHHNGFDLARFFSHQLDQTIPHGAPPGGAEGSLAGWPGRIIFEPYSRMVDLGMKIPVDSCGPFLVLAHAIVGDRAPQTTIVGTGPTPSLARHKHSDGAAGDAYNRQSTVWSFISFHVTVLTSVKFCTKDYVCSPGDGLLLGCLQGPAFHSLLFPRRVELDGMFIPHLK